MHIIYIEDDPANIALVERVVRMASDTLTTFATAEDALLHMRSDEADLILTDIDFGKGAMTGLELTRALRERGVRAPIVALTAYDLQEYVRWADLVGNNSFIVKPVDVNTLLNLFDSYRRVD